MGVVGMGGRGAQMRVSQIRVISCRQYLLGVRASIWELGQGVLCGILWRPCYPGGYVCRQPAPCLAFGGMAGRRAKS